MKKSIIVITVLVLALMLGTTVAAYATDAEDTLLTTTAVEEQADADTAADGGMSAKAYAAAITIALASLAGAFAMGIAISKAVEGISRQPEADGKIRSSLMLGLVFVETAIIYALIVAILIIFVL